MKRKILYVAMIMSLMLTIIPASLYAKSDVTIKINGEEVSSNIPLLMENDRILVPANGIFEKLGAEVKWDKEKNNVLIEDRYTLVEMNIGKSQALVHKKYDFTGIPLEAKLEVVPKIVNDTVYVPLRFVTESLDSTINWDNDSNTALIETKKDSNEISYSTLSPSDISGNDTLTKWYEDNKVTKGIHYTKVGDSLYVLVSAGVKNTGGYSVKITCVISNKPDEVYIIACVENPLSDSVVTQVINYPTELIRIDKAEIKHAGGTIY
jgi:hypothetical protein